MTEEKPGALARLRAGEACFGAIQTIPVPTITELMAWSGFDFVILDCEHGVIDEPGQLACLQALSGSGLFSGVRVRPGEFGAVGRYLDFGADAILMPDIKGAEEARAFVAAATPGPSGSRSSTGAARARRFGIAGPPSPEPLLIALIEGGQAVEAIDDIAAVQGLGALVIGPHDLSADLGCSGDFADPRYASAFARIEAAAHRHGVVLGSRSHPGYPLERLLAQRHRLLIASADVLALRDGFRSHLPDAELR